MGLVYLAYSISKEDSIQVASSNYSVRESNKEAMEIWKKCAIL